MNGSHLLSTVDDEMDVDSPSSGTNTPNPNTPNATMPMTTDTTDSECSAEDDSSVFSVTVSSDTSGIGFTS